VGGEFLASEIASPEEDTNQAIISQ
jgi:hypothetical protein